MKPARIRMEINGIRPDMPVCKICGSSDHVTIHDYEDCWAYFCEHCKYTIPLEEIDGVML